MADKFPFNLGNEERELKIGQSFLNPKAVAYHTIKYDFKPASVDKNKIATVDVGNNNQVTVTVPHSDGSGVPHTVFKGSQRPYTKECVLIIDKRTGEITLERLSCNIQVKKTRSESSKMPQPADRPGQSSSERSGSSTLASRSSTPPVGQRVSSKTKVTSGSRRPDRPITNLIPKHSPLQASPRYPSPNQNKSPKDELRVDHLNGAGSLPLIGMMDDFPDPPRPINTSTTPTPPAPQQNSASSLLDKPNSFFTPEDIGEISDSSSSSSDDDDDDSDSDEVNSTIIERSLTNGHSNGIQNAAPKFNSVPTSHLLKEDLCLSESGSDSD